MIYAIDTPYGICVKVLTKNHEISISLEGGFEIEGNTGIFHGRKNEVLVYKKGTSVIEERFTNLSSSELADLINKLNGE